MMYNIIRQTHLYNVLFSAENILSSFPCLVNLRTDSNFQEAFSAPSAGPRHLLHFESIFPAVAVLYQTVKTPCLPVCETFPEYKFLKDKDHTHVYIPERVVGID